MLQFTIKLYSDFHRPIFDIHNNKIVALLDTGAVYPVWTGSEESLIKTLKAKSLNATTSVSGFGGNSIGKIYIVPLLQIGKLYFPNMHIVVCNSIGNASFSLILSATMFKGLIYEIDTVNNCFNVTIPDKESNIRNYKILDSNGNIHILCQSAEQIHVDTSANNKHQLTKEDFQANYVNTLIKKYEK